MPLPDLTTLGQVTRSIQDFPSNDEVKIVEWIAAASALIREETGRDFRAPSEVVETTVETFGSSRIYVPELLNADDVEWVRDDYGSPRTFRFSQPHQHRNKGAYIVVEPNYTVRDSIENTAGGLGPGIADPIPWEHRDNAMREFRDGYRPNLYGNFIVLRARVGYDAIPAQINLLAERTVRRWYYGIANFGHTVEREETGVPGEILPPTVLSGLQKWILPRRKVLTP